MFKHLFLFAFLICSAGCQVLKDSFHPDRLAIHSGYTFSEIKGENVRAVPSAIRFENNFHYLPRKYGKLNIGVEAFGLAVIEPNLNKIVGITSMLRYSYPITGRFSPYIEGGAGPIYLGFNTYEQERKGFSFYDQIGGGLEIKIYKRLHLILGYRFTHISHGGLLSTRNRGLEGHTTIFGFSFELP